MNICQLSQTQKLLSFANWFLQWQSWQTMQLQTYDLEQLQTKTATCKVYSSGEDTMHATVTNSRLPSSKMMTALISSLAVVSVTKCHRWNWSRLANLNPDLSPLWRPSFTLTVSLVALVHYVLIDSAPCSDWSYTLFWLILHHILIDSIAEWFDIMFWLVL